MKSVALKILLILENVEKLYKKENGHNYGVRN